MNEHMIALCIVGTYLAGFAFLSWYGGRYGKEATMLVAIFWPLLLVLWPLVYLLTLPYEMGKRKREKERCKF